jgi:hypothetical protein
MISTNPRPLSSRLDLVHAQARVADALLGVALDVLEPFASEYLSAADYSHARLAVQAPVTAATEAALAALAKELALIVEADPWIAARLDRTQNSEHPAAE